MFCLLNLLQEGDLIVAEVREVYRDGSLHLHMPGSRTGRLGEGCVLRLPPSLIRRHCVLRLPPSLIRRQKMHIHKIDVPSCVGGDEKVPVGLILGCNGLVWIGPERGLSLGAHLGATIAPEKPMHPTSRLIGVEKAERYAIGRVRNVVLSLAACGHLVWETAVVEGCLASYAEEREDAGEGWDADDDYGGCSSGPRITRFLLPEYQRQLVDLVIARLAAAQWKQNVNTANS